LLFHPFILPKVVRVTNTLCLTAQTQAIERAILKLMILQIVATRRA